MQDIHFHIAYLLTKHECVVIPDFGAFIVSPVISEKSKVYGVFSPPSHFLGFNSDIRHNDGLLAHSVAKDKHISYKEACKVIRDFVDLVKNQLSECKPVDFPWIGRFVLSSEQKLIFRPSGRLSCNASDLGFSKFHLTCLKDLEELQTIPSTESSATKKDDYLYVPLRRKFVLHTGTAAAALLALFLVSTPLNKSNPDSYLQSASVFCHTKSPVVSLSELTAEKTSIEENDISANSLAFDQITEEETIATPPTTVEIEVAPAPSKYYYIVVASLPTLSTAEKTLDRFKANGFENAEIISSDERHRIYVKKMADKIEAETYLKEFRDNNPEHAKAWLLSQRNSK